MRKTANLVIGALPWVFCLSLVRADEIDSDRTIHKANPLTAPFTADQVEPATYDRYIQKSTDDMGQREGRTDVMLKRYPQFLQYFRDRSKDPKEPKKFMSFDKLTKIVAEIRAESDNVPPNHRFSLHDVTDACFLRNALCKSKLAEHGEDITQVTATLISRHGWLKDAVSTQSADLNKKLEEKETLTAELAGIGALNFFKSKRKSEIRDRLRQLEREIVALPKGTAQRDLPRWTYHSVCVINTDKGPFVFDPDVKSRSQRFAGDLLVPLKDWMQFDWNDFNPNFILAPYNYTELNQLRYREEPPPGSKKMAGIPPQPHGFEDQRYGHLFGKTPDDSIWQTDRAPPQMLEKASNGKLQINRELLNNQIERMTTQSYLSIASYNANKCRKTHGADTPASIECLKAEWRTYCAAVYNYEVHDVTGYDSTVRPDAKLTDPDDIEFRNHSKATARACLERTAGIKVKRK